MFFFSLSNFEEVILNPKVKSHFRKLRAQKTKILVRRRVLERDNDEGDFLSRSSST